MSFWQSWRGGERQGMSLPLLLPSPATPSALPSPPASLLSVLPGGSLLEDSAFGYFITACVVILLAIGSYILLPRLVRTCPSQGGEGCGPTPAGDHPSGRGEWGCCALEEP